MLEGILIIAGGSVVFIAVDIWFRNMVDKQKDK